jgi:hypothetical protein
MPNAAYAHSTGHISPPKKLKNRGQASKFSLFEARKFMYEPRRPFYAGWLSRRREYRSPAGGAGRGSRGAQAEPRMQGGS